MTLSIKTFEQKEWDLYDSNSSLDHALESVENGDLQYASECFQRIAWVLCSLSKYHPPDINKKDHMTFQLLRKDDDK